MESIQNSDHLVFILHQVCRLVSCKLVKGLGFIYRSFIKAFAPWVSRNSGSFSLQSIYVCMVCHVCRLQEMSWMQWEAVALFRCQDYVLMQQLWLGQGPAVPHLQGRWETKSGNWCLPWLLGLLPHHSSKLPIEAIKVQTKWFVFRFKAYSVIRSGLVYIKLCINYMLL